MIIYENNFVEYLSDWINLHEKNETADTVFKNSIVILLKFYLGIKNPQYVTEKLKVFLGLRKKLFSWKHMFYQLRSTMKTDQSAAASKFSRLAIHL